MGSYFTFQENFASWRLKLELYNTVLENVRHLNMNLAYWYIAYSELFSVIWGSHKDGYENCSLFGLMLCSLEDTADFQFENIWEKPASPTAGFL